MAAPTTGNASSNVTNLGAVAAALPAAAPAIGDRAICVIAHRDNVVGTPTPSDTAGFGPWSQVSGSPVVQGAARLTVWESTVESTTPTAPTISDSGDHQQIRVFYVNHPSGTPVIHATQASTDATSDTGGNATCPTTTVADCLLVLCGATDTPDANQTNEFGTPANTSLTSIVKLADNGVTTGGGSGKLIVKGIKATAGAVNDWTYTKLTAGVKAHLVIAFSPPAAAPPTATTVARISLESAGTPDTRTLHTIKARVRKASGTNPVLFKAALYEGGTNRSGDLATAGISTSFADYTLTIPDASAANITDYSNLEIRFWATCAAGDTVNVDVAEIYLEIPASSAPPSTPISVPVTLTLTPTLARVKRAPRVISAGLTLGASMSLKKFKAVPAGLPLTASVTRKEFESVQAALIMTPALAPKALKTRAIPVGLTLTPVLTEIATHPRALSASLTLTPVISDIATHYRAISAGLTLTPVMQRRLFKAMPVGLTLTPALQAVKQLVTIQIPLSAGLVLTPVLTEIAFHPRALSAGLTLTPTLQRIPIRPRALSAGLTLTPAMQRIATHYIAMPLGIILTNINTPKLTVVAIRPKAISAGLTLTPAMVNPKFAPRALSAGLVLTPAMQRIATHYFALNAPLVLTPQMNRRLFKPMPVSLILSPTMVALKGVVTIPIALSAGLVLTPALTKTQTRLRALSAALTLTPAMQRIAIHPRTVASSLTLTPAFQKKQFRAMVAGLTLTPTLTKWRLKYQTLPAGLTLTPALSFALTTLIKRNLDAALILTPTVTPRKTAYRALSASLPLTPAMQSKKFRALVAGLVLTATLTRVKLKFFALPAGLVLTPATTRRKTTGRLIGANLSLSAILVRRRTGLIPLSASMGLTATLTRGLKRSIPAGLALTPVLVKVKLGRRTISTVLVMTPALSFEKLVGTKTDISLDATLLLPAEMFAVRLPPEVIESGLHSAGLPQAVLLGAGETDVPELVSAITAGASRILSAAEDGSEIVRASEPTETRLTKGHL